MKHLERAPRARLRLAFGCLALLALGAIGCGRIAKPEGWAQPVESGDVLVVAHDERMFALDAETLEAKWAFPSEAAHSATPEINIDPVALYGTPAIAQGTVFVPTYDGKLYALDEETGKLRWPEPIDTGGPLVGGVTVSQDTVYFGSDDGKVYAVDIESGNVRWSAATDRGVWSTPQLAGGALYVTSLDNKLHVFNTADGAELWSFKTDASIAASPTVDEAANRVYVAGFDSKLRAIDTNTHEQLWSVSASNWFWGQPLVSGGVVYAGSLDNHVYAVDATTGSSHWANPFNAGGPIRSRVALAGGRLVAVSRDGNVYSLDPATGAATGSSPLVLASEVLADPLVVAGRTTRAGEVLLVTKGGELLRIDPAEPSVIDQRNLD